MNDFINCFKDSHLIYKFFKIKKFFIIFFLFLICTIIETLNIALILPAISFIFGDQNNLIFVKIFDFFNLNNFSKNKNFIYLISISIIILFTLKSIILIILQNSDKFFALIRYRISSFFFNYYISQPYIYFLNEKESSK